MAIALAEEVDDIVEILGGSRVFGEKVRDVQDLQRTLRRGLPYRAFEALGEALDMPMSQLASLVGVSLRTLARRRSARRLSSIESDRLYRVARVALLASQVLGSLAKAREWLNSSNRALGGESPISLLDTSVGERNVEETLLRIHYGIYS